jgi:hypothetical protein
LPVKHTPARELRAATEAQAHASDRAASRMSRNGTTRRMEAVYGGEG